jgi:hypothetical protein
MEREWSFDLFPTLRQYIIRHYYTPLHSIQELSAYLLENLDFLALNLGVSMKSLKVRCTVK